MIIIVINEHKGKIAKLLKAYDNEWKNRKEGRKSTYIFSFNKIFGKRLDKEPA